MSSSHKEVLHLTLESLRRTRTAEGCQGRRGGGAGPDKTHAREQTHSTLHGRRNTLSFLPVLLW